MKTHHILLGCRESNHEQDVRTSSKSHYLEPNKQRLKF